MVCDPRNRPTLLPSRIWEMPGADESKEVGGPLLSQGKTILSAIG